MRGRLGRPRLRWTWWGW